MRISLAGFVAVAGFWDRSKESEAASLGTEELDVLSRKFHFLKMAFLISVARERRSLSVVA